MPDHDPIRIAGAGPSGLAAAIILARAGRAVEVHEAKGDVGTRFIGDLQIIEGASETEPVPDFLDRLGIERNFYFRPTDWATFYDHRGVGRVIHSNEPYGYFIHRGAEEGTLDRGLLAQAQRAGANVVFNSRLPADQADIVATGPASPDGLAKEMTWRVGCRESGVGGRSSGPTQSTIDNRQPTTDNYASSDSRPPAPPELIDVYFNHKLAPGGYSYLFILDEVATFGCAIVADFKQIDSYFDHSLAAARSIHGFEVPADARTGYSYMNFHLKRAATSNGARFVGEAAGFQDYLFGLGIRYALTSGSLAARSILEERDYDELWKSALETKQKTSLVNRFLYETGGNFGLSMFVRQAAHAKDFHRYLSGWHRNSWWKSLLSPVIRRVWKHDGRCLHKPGPHWCRARDTEMKVPPLGPSAGSSGAQ
ncbi:MAG TPA: NAD(P)/FAD-dependent oxidoreductase [Thermoanaerobaculia bacterium]|jgi:flavin-dependent dehydrogenase|nr:NAD(P)/FAD-dependent oxidoreductase [Thermoanaerobaculia bacterium]